jgi:hypothetical protein
MDTLDNTDTARDREATLDAGPWKRNLIICLLGSFTTIVAMTLLLPQAHADPGQPRHGDCDIADRPFGLAVRCVRRSAVHVNI